MNGFKGHTLNFFVEIVLFWFSVLIVYIGQLYMYVKRAVIISLIPTNRKKSKACRSLFNVAIRGIVGMHKYT